MSLLKIIIYYLAFMFFYNAIYAYKINPRDIKCPVCLKDFVTVDHGSSIEFDEKELFIYNAIITCPYCMYTSLSYDFNNLTETERIILLKNIPKIKIKFSNKEKKVFADMKDLDFFLPVYIAKEIDKFRSPSKKRKMDLILFQYFRTKVKYLNSLEPVYRKMAIKELKIMLDEKLYKDYDQLAYTYLLGQFYISDGSHSKALKCFEKVLSFSDGLTLPNPRIIQRSKEQIAFLKLSFLTIQELDVIINRSSPDLNHLNDQTTSLAIQCLSKNNDLISWQIVGEFVMKDVNRLNMLSTLVKPTKEKLQIYNKFWLWVQEQYYKAESEIKEQDKESSSVWHDILSNYSRFMPNYRDEKLELINEIEAIWHSGYESLFFDYVSKSGDTLPRIANMNNTDVSRVLELNPLLNANNKFIAENTVIKFVKTPNNYSESVFIRHIATLLKENNRDAQNYFFKWLTTVGPHYFYRLDGSILDCLLILKNKNDSWQLPNEESINANDQQKMIYQCLLMIKGIKNTEEYLLAYLPTNHNIGNEIPLGILKSFNCKSAKNILIDFLKTNISYIGFDVEDYLKWAGSVDDIIELEKIVMVSRERKTPNTISVEQSIQMSLESIIMAIKFKILAKKCLKNI